MNSKDCLDLFDNMTTKDFSQGADKPVREYLADLDARHSRIMEILDARIAEFPSLPANTALRLVRIQVARELELL